MKANIGFVWNELRKAFDAGQAAQTAKETANAEKRVRQFTDVVTGILSGKLNIGSRKPTDYPIWVTAEVARGGFATGKAAAAERASDEHEAILALDVQPLTREALFAKLISDEGLAGLKELLSSRMYKIEFPEDAALLVIAWLCENGRAKDAELIVNEISTYASGLRFMPKKNQEPLQKTELVHRYSSNDIRSRLNNYKSNIRIETQREALQIWIPFVDRLFFHWVEIIDNDTTSPSYEWKSKAAELIDEYEDLKKSHLLCRKYHNKKENLQIVLAATRDFLNNKQTSNALSRVRHAVTCYVKAHGGQNDERHIEVRKYQRQIALRPAHKVIANAISNRFPVSDRGLANLDCLLSPIALEGCGDIPIPGSICKIARKATMADIPSLIKRGIIPSSEIIADIAPQLTALEIGNAYSNEDIGLLMSETYKAFARRRSVLLFNLASQVRFNELPWVKPLLDERQSADCYKQTALRIAAYAIDFFPGVILPNSLVAQLNLLYSLAGKGNIFLSELAADIFMGKFVPSYDKSAVIAASLLRATLYERYYNLDYAKFNSTEIKENNLLAVAVNEQLIRYEYDKISRVVKNGMPIELAQIYTTHNLAILVSEDVKFENSYENLAFKAFDEALKLISLSKKKKEADAFQNYLRTIKNAAYAWRQAIFFLSFANNETAGNTVKTVKKRSLCLLGDDITNNLFRRLENCAQGECPTNDKIFLGWTSGVHWVIH